MTPDLKARRLLMSAHLYYDRDSPVLSDADYEALSDAVAHELEIAELTGESDIDPVRLAQLGSADQVRSSGFHLRLTQATVGGAEAWHLAETGEPVDTPYVFDGEEDPIHGVLFARVTG
jgi:hypothetical protein